MDTEQLAAACKEWLAVDADCINCIKHRLIQNRNTVMSEITIGISFITRNFAIPDPTDPDFVGCPSVSDLRNPLSAY